MLNTIQLSYQRFPAILPDFPRAPLFALDFQNMSSIEDPSDRSTMTNPQNEQRPESTVSHAANEQATSEQYSDSIYFETFDAPSEHFDTTKTPCEDRWKDYQPEHEVADDTTTDLDPWNASIHQYRAEPPSTRSARLASKKKRSGRGIPSPGTDGRHERVKAQASKTKRGVVCRRRREESLSWGF